MDIDDLQQSIDRELKALPAPRAPESLLPRVLAATVLRKRALAPGTPPGLALPGRVADLAAAPWYARPWLTWPRAWQVASLVVFVALGAGGWMFFAGGTAAGIALPRPPEPVATALTTLSQAAALVRVYWRLLIEPVAFLALVLALSLSLACAGIWLALDRDGIGASQQ